MNMKWVKRDCGLIAKGELMSECQRTRQCVPNNERD